MVIIGFVSELTKGEFVSAYEDCQNSSTLNEENESLKDHFKVG